MAAEGAKSGMTTQSGQQQAGQEQQADAGGSQQQANAAQNAPPQWLAEHLNDEAKRTDFIKFARSTFDEDFKAHKEAAEKRERSLTGQVSAAKAYQSLSDEARSEWQAEISDRDRAVKKAIEDGVPQALLDDRPTATSVRSFARKYLETNGGNSGSKQSAGAGDDLEARITNRVLAAINGNGTTQIHPQTREKMGIGGGAGVLPVQQKSMKDMADGDYDPKVAGQLLKSLGLRN